MRAVPAIAAAVLIALAAAPASAAMDVATFLAKATALKSKGPLALLSSDMGLLKREGAAAAQELRAERNAAKAAGSKPAFCPPDKGAMSGMEMVAALSKIPPAQRGISLTDGFRRVLAQRYPC